MLGLLAAGPFCYMVWAQTAVACSDQNQLQPQYATDGCPLEVRSHGP